MKVCAITATCGRHHLMERSLRFFLEQDYKGEHTLLIFNNSEVSQSLGEMVMPENKQVILINNYLSFRTGKPYETLGDIYNDALLSVPSETDAITHADDDDIFLPNHISEGVEGLEKAMAKSPTFMVIDVNNGDTRKMSIDYRAYKPEKSYYRHPGGIELMGNNLEPSVFVDAQFIREHGYSLTTSDQHMSWFSPLLNEGKMFIDPKGVPTMIYNWGDTDIPTFKTSGNAGNPNNFDNYRNFSRDHGDGVLTPWKKEEVQKYYDLVYAK